MADQTFNVNCGFFDSINKDRLYSADEMNRPYKRIISNGVFATSKGTPSTDLQTVSASDGLKIIVKKGEGLFADKWFENPVDLYIDVPANSDVSPRRDSVIVQVDKRQNGRSGNIVYRTGTPSTNPQPPAIGTVTNVIEYRIANIYVAAGARNINNDAIVDLRGSSECSWITSLIQQVDTSTLYAQWQAAYQKFYDEETVAFETWLAGLTQELTVSTSVVKYESHYTTTTDGETVIPINIASFNKSKDVLMVRVNNLFATEGSDYTIASDSSKITLTKDLQSGQHVDFIVLQSVIVGDTAAVISSLSEINALVSALNTTVASDTNDTGWINFTLEGGATAFDSSSTPACRKYGNRTHLRGSIKGVTATGTTICTLPASMKPAMDYQFTTAAISSGAANICVFEVSASNGTIKLIAKSGTISNTAELPIATSFIVG
ncbi:hypothetical protein [Priestia megaterium]|uniref:hypothetical protein n=1 Tax=Priestia megaterium TaxID=1404 RepID=UPI002E1C7DFE|nr:hypothetical protein [Priestia megaterium]